MCQQCNKQHPFFSPFTQINAEDIDFRVKEYDVLRREEEHGMYPPKFSVGITSLDGARSTKVHFCFFGASRKMATEIPLKVPVQGMILVRLFYSMYNIICWGRIKAFNALSMIAYKVYLMA